MAAPDVRRQVSDIGLAQHFVDHPPAHPQSLVNLFPLRRDAIVGDPISLRLAKTTSRHIGLDCEQSELGDRYPGAALHA